MKSVKKVYSDRTEWCNENGRLHREDGPAIEYTDGSKQWYLNEEELTEREFNKQIQQLKLKNFKFDKLKRFRNLV